MCKNTYINPRKIFLVIFLQKTGIHTDQFCVDFFLIQWVSESTSKLAPVLRTYMNKQLQQIYSENCYIVKMLPRIYFKEMWCIY